MAQKACCLFSKCAISEVGWRQSWMLTTFDGTSAPIELCDSGIRRRDTGFNYLLIINGELELRAFCAQGALESQRPDERSLTRSKNHVIGGFPCRRDSARKEETNPPPVGASSAWSMSDGAALDDSDCRESAETACAQLSVSE